MLRRTSNTSLISLILIFGAMILDTAWSQKSSVQNAKSTWKTLARVDPADAPKSCFDLAVIGHTLNGYYGVLNETTQNMDAIHCDFKQSAQTLVHTSHPIIKFDVGRSTSYITGNSIIPFDSAQVNVGDAIQPASGVFTVPVDGTYLFTFTGVKTNTVTDSFIQLRKNGVTVASAFAPGLPNVVGFSSIHTMLDLVAGDLIYLYLVYGTLYDDANSHTHFTGSLKVPSEVV